MPSSPPSAALRAQLRKKILKRIDELNLKDVEAAGVSMEKVCADLLNEGVASFAKSFQDLLGAVEARRKEIPAPPKK